MTGAFTDGAAAAERVLTKLRHAPSGIALTLGAPVVMVVLFGYIFGSAITVPGRGDYRAFLIPGLFAMGAGWLGGLVDNMETWAEHFARRLRSMLSLRPIEYVQRNIRIGVMGHERIDRYLQRYPELVDVYCFESDYPHSEGGIDPAAALVLRLNGLGSDVVEKFFVKNAEWLMPA